MTDTLGRPPKVADFCRLVGVSWQRVTVLRQNGHVTGETMAAWIGSYCANLRQQAAGRGDDALVLTQERAALAAAQRRKLEREERVAERELVVWKVVKRDVQRAAHGFRDSMLSVPGRVVAQLAGIADERVIDQMLTKIIREELDRLTSTPDPLLQADP